MAEDLTSVIKEFKDYRRRNSIEAVENYLSQSQHIPQIVRASLKSQTQQSISPDVFQWLYDCVSMKRKSSKVFVFVVQFVPDLILLYSQSVSENQTKLKGPVEVLLLAIAKEIESDPKDEPITIPTLTRPSIYHQTTPLASQSRLTETALSRHNYDHQSGTTSSLHITPTVFADKQITASNRLPFITTVLRESINNITLFNAHSQTSFCVTCTRIVLTGMTQRCIEQVIQSSPSHPECISSDDLLTLCKAKRITINDDFVTTLLHGLRMCLFQPCYNVAKQALAAVRIRAEYSFYSQSLQISQALERQVNEIHPLRLPLDTEIHKTYSNKDGSNWASRPSTVIRTMMGQVLHHHLNPTQHDEVDGPHDVSDERLSVDVDELLVSRSYDGSVLVESQDDHPLTPSPSSDDEGGLSFEIRDIDESPSASFTRRSGDQTPSMGPDGLSLSDITVTDDSPTTTLKSTMI